MLTAKSDYTYSGFGVDLLDTTTESGESQTWELHYTKPVERGQPHTIQFPTAGKKVGWLVPLEMGKGVLSRPTKQLETPNGIVNIYQTSNGVNELSSRIIRYWAYDAQTGKFLSYGSKSLWASDRYDYDNWEKKVLANFCSVD